MPDLRPTDPQDGELTALLAGDMILFEDFSDEGGPRSVMIRRDAGTENERFLRLGRFGDNRFYLNESIEHFLARLEREAKLEHIERKPPEDAGPRARLFELRKREKTIILR